jgi:hypothetical protein
LKYKTTRRIERIIRKIPFPINVSVIWYTPYPKIEIDAISLIKQDFDRNEIILKLIKNPKSALVTKQQGFYHYLNGLIQSQKNLTIAEKHFREALKLGLSMSHDIAMAKLSLAGIMMQKRRKREAQSLLSEAKSFDKHNMLSAQIKLMQEQMKRI